MSRSPALKIFNKFHGWTKHDATLRSERTAAQEEFLPGPDSIAEDCENLAVALCEDWFLFERPLTSRNITPLKLFLNERGAKLKRAEAAAYEAFLSNHRFGLFKIENVHPGQGLTLKSAPGNETFEIVDVNASESGERGDFLIARIIPYENHWAFPGFVSSLPNDGSGFLERSAENNSPILEKERLMPRHVLRFFIKRVDWEAEGLDRVKARLASILQRWGVEDITASKLEDAVAQAHASGKSQPALFTRVLERAPYRSEIDGVQDLLNALWNLSIEEHRPDIDPAAIDKGPVERRLIRQFADTMLEKVPTKDLEDPETAKAVSRERFQEWIDVPQQSLEGKTPREMILKERKARGNPETRIGYSISLTPFKLDDSRWKKGVKLAERAQALLFADKAKESTELYTRASSLLKGYPGLFRVYGNLAGGRIRLGDREGALEALRAALKLNPDYKIARDNLHLLESMSPEEFDRRQAEGFFRKTQIIRDDE